MLTDHPFKIRCHLRYHVDFHLTDLTLGVNAPKVGHQNQLHWVRSLNGRFQKFGTDTHLHRPISAGMLVS
jgi:hypothetical protein